jgi:hypothetical protein
MDKQPEEEVEVEHLPELDNEGDDAEKPHFRVRKAKEDSEESADIGGLTNGLLSGRYN